MIKINTNEYKKSISNVVVEDLTNMASEIASNLINQGIYGDTPIFIEEETKEVPGPIQFKSYGKITTTKLEKVTKVSLKGWALIGRVVECEDKLKMYESTMSLYLGEDGFLYNGEEEWWCMKDNKTHWQKKLKVPSKLTSTYDFEKWDKKNMWSNLGYNYLFGEDVKRSLLNLSDLIPYVTRCDNLGDNFYGIIINVEEWGVLTNTNNNPELQHERWDKTQVMRFTRNSNGTYQIQSILNEMCLDVYERNSNDGAHVCFYEANNTVAQQWRIENQPWEIGGIGSGQLFGVQCSPKRVLDRTDGTKTAMWHRHDGVEQRFIIYKLNLNDYLAK